MGVLSTPCGSRIPGVGGNKILGNLQAAEAPPTFPPAPPRVRAPSVRLPCPEPRLPSRTRPRPTVDLARRPGVGGHLACWSKLSAPAENMPRPPDRPAADRLGRRRGLSARRGRRYWVWGGGGRRRNPGAAASVEAGTSWARSSGKPEPLRRGLGRRRAPFGDGLPVSETSAAEAGAFRRRTSGNWNFNAAEAGALRGRTSGIWNLKTVASGGS